MKYSVILGRDVSQSTAKEIERIESYINHSIRFEYLPEDNPHGFGYADFLAEPDRIVHSVTNLPQSAFEANLLHESYHLCQAHDGFPTTSTIPQPDLNKNDYEFLCRIGSASASTILDLDVCDRIKSFGLSSEYFFNVRYQQAISLNLEKLTHRDDRVSVTIRLAGIILQNSRFQSQNVIKHYQVNNQNITRKAQKLASKIKRCNHNTPIGCFECLTAMYDYLDIWDWQAIIFQDMVIQDSGLANKILEQYRNSPL